MTDRISLREAHQFLTDGFFWFCVVVVILIVVIIIYSYNANIIYSHQYNDIKFMDCQTLKNHLLKGDLIIPVVDLQSQIIGRCLK